MECNIPYQKNSFTLTDNVDNILTYVDIEDLRGRPFWYRAYQTQKTLLTPTCLGIRALKIPNVKAITTE